MDGPSAARTANDAEGDWGMTFTSLDRGGASIAPVLPGAPEGAAARDKIVWDHLSDQPH